MGLQIICNEGCVDGDEVKAIVVVSEIGSACWAAECRKHRSRAPQIGAKPTRAPFASTLKNKVTVIFQFRRHLSAVCPEVYDKNEPMEYGSGQHWQEIHCCKSGSTKRELKDIGRERNIGTEVEMQEKFEVSDVEYGRRGDDESGAF